VSEDIGPLTEVMAVGARVGIGVCPVCGAALMLDPREPFDPVSTHAEWHRKNDRREVSA